MRERKKDNDKGKEIFYTKKIRQERMRTRCQNDKENVEKFRMRKRE